MPFSIDIGNKGRYIEGMESAARTTLRRSATKEKPQRTLWLMLGALFAAAMAAAVFKTYQSFEDSEALRVEMNAAPLKLPEASIPASLNEPVGILADKSRGEDKMAVSGLDTSSADPSTAMKALQLSNQLMPVIGRYGNEPIVQQFKHDFAKDPELSEMMSQFEKDGNVNALVKGLQNSASFRDIVGRYMSDPRFEQLIRQAQAGGPAAASQAPLKPPPSMLVKPAPQAATAADSDDSGSSEDEEEASAPSEAEAEDAGPMIDPGKVSAGEDASSKTPAPPPPEPKRR